MGKKKSSKKNTDSLSKKNGENFDFSLSNLSDAPTSGISLSKGKRKFKKTASKSKIKKKDSETEIKIHEPKPKRPITDSHTGNLKKKKKMVAKSWRVPLADKRFFEHVEFDKKILQRLNTHIITYIRGCVRQNGSERGVYVDILELGEDFMGRPIIKEVVYMQGFDVLGYYNDVRRLYADYVRALEFDNDVVSLTRLERYNRTSVVKSLNKLLKHLHYPKIVDVERVIHELVGELIPVMPTSLMDNEYECYRYNTIEMYAGSPTDYVHFGFAGIDWIVTLDRFKGLFNEHFISWCRKLDSPLPYIVVSENERISEYVCGITLEHSSFDEGLSSEDLGLYLPESVKYINEIEGVEFTPKVPIDKVSEVELSEKEEKKDEKSAEPLTGVGAERDLERKHEIELKKIEVEKIKAETESKKIEVEKLREMNELIKSLREIGYSAFEIKEMIGKM